MEEEEEGTEREGLFSDGVHFCFLNCDSLAGKGLRLSDTV